LHLLHLSGLNRASNYFAGSAEDQRSIQAIHPGPKRVYG
jgi:hypothetical protein